MFYVGNIGKKQQGDSTDFSSSIELISGDLLSKKGQIRVGKMFPNIQDIQGVAVNEIDKTIWFCSCRENMVYHIEKSGLLIDTIRITSPSGICFDMDLNCIWVLNKTHLLKISNNNIEQSFPISVDGQDHLCYDSVRKKIMMTAGIDYFGDSYIYKIDKETGNFTIMSILKDSHAIEGIAYKNESIFIANDGFYHNAKNPTNQINVYKLPK